MFSVIKAENRINRMLTWFAGICTAITDFNVGSKFRSKLETVAVEMEAQDMAFLTAARRSISAGIYSAFGFNLIPAIAGNGLAIFTSEDPAVSDITIPIGTQITAPATDTDSEKTYETIEECVLLTGQTSVSVLVACTIAGVFGNTGANTITNIKNPITGIDSVTNPSAIISGRDRESNDARRTRFQLYIASLHQGTNSALVTAAKKAIRYNGSGVAIETVVSAVVPEPGSPVGNVACYIYNGSGAATSTLITAAQKNIDGYVDTEGQKIPGAKAAGVVVTVQSATAISQDVTVEVMATPDANKIALDAEIREVIGNYLAGLDISQPLIYNALIERIMSIEGITNIDLTTPSADVPIAPYQVITAAGTIVVTFL